MSETIKATKSNAKEPVSASDLVAELAKLLGRLGEISAFKDTELEFSEWSFMRGVEAMPDLGAGPIARRLGLTPQRGSQLVADLAAKSYMTSTTSADDTRRKVLGITPRGKSKLRLVDEGLSKLFADAVPDAPKAITNMSRHVNRLLKAASPPSTKA